MSEAVKRECTKKERELVRKLARIVFNKWYSETLMENVIVLPEEPSDEHNKSPSPNKSIPKSLPMTTESDYMELD